jgi:NAD(P)-dependent dehydrogenase (short-subunit alcohol dehydrogenase family)
MAFSPTIPIIIIIPIIEEIFNATFVSQSRKKTPARESKAGVLALTRSLAVEWAKYGIRTNAVAPGLSRPKALSIA